MTSLNEIFHKVQKPGRYIGEETNSVRKTHDRGRVSVALAYPDTYEVGMSYLGLRILYHLLNERDDVVCERVFAPWPDMESELAFAGRRLFSLESGKDLREFDIVGFSLSYELTYTNVLNMLDMGGISVRSEERKDEEPLVIAGGACCYNPEPMSPFIDVFLIGDAEEALPALVERYRSLKKKGVGRKRILKGLSALEGVYVPALYDAVYDGDGFSGIRPLEEDVPATVQKAIVTDLENAYYPVKQIVPLVRIVHDRIAMEIMRGCPNKCRFCQARAINRPVRFRSPEKIRELCRDTYESTGYESVALLSLSSVNYPGLADLVRGVNKDLEGKGVAISIPSLRVDEAFYDLPEMIASIKKAGLTFAPETACEEVRSTIGKDIDMQVLCKSALLAYEHGWRKLKLYFMVGFPAEPEEEADNILSLARELSSIRKKVSRGAAEIRVSVNPFVPKPHTPFQWLGMRDPTVLSGIKDSLLARPPKKIKVDFHDIERSVLEGALARGDRRAGDAVLGAWKKGARMDGWSDHFDASLWKEAFAERGMDVVGEATKMYLPESPLPWGHIRSSGEDEFLKKEFEQSGLPEVLRRRDRH